MMELVLVILGMGVALGTLGAILWSVAYPMRRLWPPQRYNALTPFLIWVPTFALFGALVGLGVLGWGAIALPNWLRFGVGVPLIVLGNLGVWAEVAKFGVPQTGGAKGTLKTDGLYRYSRNPQYVADSAMVLGWILLSAAPWVILVGVPAIAILLVAPLSEEPWLEENYGQPYRDYMNRVRRYL